MRVQRQSHGAGTRHLFGIGLAMLAMLVLGLIQPVGAQRDYASCGHFETQEDAQAALEENPELATTLDSDGDGIACEELTTGGPVVVDPVSCGFFETQEDAQAALDENPDLATTLDSDGDGIACNEYGTGERTIVVCDEWNGTLVELSEEIVPGSVDFPYHFATDAEIAAGTCAATRPVTPGVVICNEALGTLVEVSQGALDQDALDFPFHRATDAEIAAGECATVVVCNEVNGRLLEVADTEGVLDGLDFPYHLATQAEIEAGECEATAPVTPGGEGEPDKDADPDDSVDDATSDEVTALPKTGTGAAEGQAQQGPLLAALLVMTMGAIGLRSRMLQAGA